MSQMQTRTPAGVPTGGQFAASARAESDVTLTTPGPHDQALGRIATIIEKAERLQDLAKMVDVRDKARAAYGDRAKFVLPTEGGGDDGSWIEFDAYDDDGALLGTVEGGYADFHNPPPDDFYAPTGEWLRLEALDSIDLTAETRTAEMDLAQGALNAYARASVIIDDDYVLDSLHDDIENGMLAEYLGEDGEVTEEEAAAILAEYDEDAVITDRVWGGHYKEVARASDTVLSETRGRKS